MSMQTNPFVQLTLVKLREYTREPETIFWVFAFPVLMTLTLGIAFGGGSDSAVRVGVVPGAGSAAVVTALEAAPRVTVVEGTADRDDVLVREGEVTLIVEAGAPRDYRFDPALHESASARVTVDEVLQRARGRQAAFLPVDEVVTIP